MTSHGHPPRSRRLLLLGAEPAIQASLATLFRQRTQFDVQHCNDGELEFQPVPDLIVLTTKSPSQLDRVRAHFPEAAILARVPLDYQRFWDQTSADGVVDQYAPFEMILEALLDLERCDQERAS